MNAGNWLNANWHKKGIEVHIYFMRNVGDSGIDMITSEDYSELKYKMSQYLSTDGTKEFDDNDVWSFLRNGATVFIGEAFYSYIDTQISMRNNGAFDYYVPFGGGLIEIFSNENNYL